MDIEIRPLFVTNFLELHTDELEDYEVEYIGNVLLGEEDEYTEALYVAIENENVEHVKEIINKILGEDNNGKEKK